MTDFIISEEHLNDIKKWVGDSYFDEAIRSRPLSEELKKERERILDELIKVFQSETVTKFGYTSRKEQWTQKQIRTKIESLRGD